MGEGATTNICKGFKLCQERQSRFLRSDLGAVEGLLTPKNVTDTVEELCHVLLF